MAKQRLDQRVVQLGLTSSRTQAESYIKLGEVKVEGKVISKPGFLVGDEASVELTAKEQYVSRAALKLASVAGILKVDFRDKIVLDVGSSTGGFTDYALRHGARKVIAVEAGTDQMHGSLRNDPRVELHEKTDIRDVRLANDEPGTAKENRATGVSGVVLHSVPDMVVMDVSFISLRQILPGVAELCAADTQIIAMVKPQFEAEQSSLKHKGIIKNDKMRRDILKDFEAWTRDKFIIVDKADSEVTGAKGNRERFYLLQRLGAKGKRAARV